MTIQEKVGYKAIELINKQIEDGKDIDGKQYQYSEKPFAMPYSSKVMAKFGKKNKGKLYEIVEKEGKAIMIIKGGYKSYREAFKRRTDGDFLQFTGNMLSAIDIVGSDNTTVTIGFRDKRASQIAFWLNVSGAGKGRKLWKFFGLSKESLIELQNFITELEPNDVETMVSKLMPRA